MGQDQLTILLIFATSVILKTFATLIKPELSLVVSSTEPPTGKKSGTENKSAEVSPPPAKIYQMHVKSTISNRFAHTTIISKVKNVANKTQKATFSVDLPENVFISGFIMEVNGKNYSAYVKDTQEVKNDFEEVVVVGLGAARAILPAPDPDRFTISVSLDPETKAAFYLSYEQLLRWQDGHYEQVINLHPGQPVDDLSVEVVITESRKIVEVKTPPFRSYNGTVNKEAELFSKADLEMVNDTTAIVRFTPNVANQKQLNHLLNTGTNKNKGLAGQFVVQYDVEKNPKGGDVLIQDGYFVHFFAPSKLASLPKHVVLLLDTSLTRDYHKIKQFKEVANKILEQLNDKDLFNLVQFNVNIKVWDLDNSNSSVWYPVTDERYYHDFRNEESKIGFEHFIFPHAYPANAENIKKAKTAISRMFTNAGADIHSALKVGLHLVELEKIRNTNEINRQPMIMLLSDGNPSIRLISKEEIVNKISNLNSGSKQSPIFAFAFGDHVDENFLENLTSRNFGFLKRILKTENASSQFQHFYRQISSPLLTNVKFQYEPSITDLTTIEFPYYFSGSELIIAGRCGTDFKPPVVTGWSLKKQITLESTFEKSLSSVERLWAYLMVRQILERDEASDSYTYKEALKDNAQNLALKYSFVTPLSSLVIVKPNATSAIYLEKAAKGKKIKLRYLPVVFQLPAVPVDSKLSSVGKKSKAAIKSPEVVLPVPKIYLMHIKSSINNRFAHTTITSKVKNVADKAQEVIFSVVLPESGFISGFIMEVDGKNYTAYVKDKEDAKQDYEKAAASGLGAAHATVNTYESNRFTVSVNVEPESKAAFYLSYEQLLKRQDGHYEQIIDLHPGQLVPDLSVEVFITESRKILQLKTSPFHSDNKINDKEAELQTGADLEIINDTAAKVKFTPNMERQKQMAHLLGADKNNNGFAGQFIVQYDVERDPKGGDVLIQDGYFVHFFAPSELAPLPKHVVLLLDTSLILDYQQIKQFKKVANKILEQLNDNDLFNLVQFNVNVKVWDLDNSNSSVWYPVTNDRYYHDYRNEEAKIGVEHFTFPRAYPANADNIKKAKNAISGMFTNAGADIHSALKVGLHLVELAKIQSPDKTNRQPMILFLSDGDATIRLTTEDELLDKISNMNFGSKQSPIFALSFGDYANKNFLKQLTSRNFGFSWHIPKTADASSHFQDFYRQISSPLLTNIKFQYEPSVTSFTTVEFPFHFNGSELVVAGRCDADFNPAVVNGRGVNEEIRFESTIESSFSSVERLWAYLTVRQILERSESSESYNEVLKKKAHDLALKYSFVTPLSSLVIVKPNATSAVYPEEAAKAPQLGQYWRPARPFETAAPSETPTPSTTELAYATIASDLFNVLPWLKNVLNEQGVLYLQSDNYKLGLNETLTDVMACPKTPLNATGHCSLLHSCPQVHSLLTNSDIFMQHMCVLKNEYAGICCPDSG